MEVTRFPIKAPTSNKSLLSRDGYWIRAIALCLVAAD